ncbi:MAG: asparagine synthase-related protein [Pseudomonadota bacterium]
MFAGIFSRQANATPQNYATGQTLLKALSPYDQADLTGIWQEGPFLLAQATTCNTPESHREQVPYRCPTSELTIAAWARLDNREELASKLALSKSELVGMPDSMLILAAYQRWKTRCVEHLLGDFTFAIADPREHRLFLARDPLGVRPLYYLLEARLFAFATTAAIFPRLSCWQAEPDMDWMARFMVGISMSFTNTAYHNVLKLAPGHCLVVEPQKETLHRYFQFNDNQASAASRDDSWVEAYRAQLSEAVRCRLRTQYPVGSENSGGLDSATITAYTAQLLDQPLSQLHCFGFAAHDLEPEYIEEICKKWGIVNNHVITEVQEMEDATRERALRVLGYPEEHSNGTFHVPFYEWCQQFGIRTLLSGFGGDEVVTNPANQMPFELLLDRQYKALWHHLSGNPLRRAVRFAKTVARFRKRRDFSPNMFAAFNHRWPHQLLRGEIAERLNLREEYINQASFDAPYNRVNDFILQNRLAPFVATRLENCTLMAQSYGVDYRWPLLDARLIQQYLSTPAIEKAGPGIGRYLHRRAIEGVVPPKVQWKVSKDMGVANHKSKWQAIQLEQAARDGLRQEMQMHPAVEVLIDRTKFQEQIQRAIQGSDDINFIFQFKRNVSHVAWLNHWLHSRST